MEFPIDNHAVPAVVLANVKLVIGHLHRIDFAFFADDGHASADGDGYAIKARIIIALYVFVMDHLHQFFANRNHRFLIDVRKQNHKFLTAITE